MSNLIFYVPATILSLITVVMGYFEYKIRREPRERAMTVVCRLSETQSETPDPFLLSLSPAAIVGAILAVVGFYLTNSFLSYAVV